VKGLLKPTPDRYDLRETLAGADAMSQKSPASVRGARMTHGCVSQANHGFTDQFQVFACAGDLSASASCGRLVRDARAVSFRR